MGRLRSWLHSDDPFLGATNVVAAMLAWNQPFYPLYLWLIIGDPAWATWPAVVLTFAFAAVPLLGRHASLGARIALPLVGIANTVLYLALLGETSGVGLFLLPCAMLTAMLFRWKERLVMVAIASIPLVVWLAMRGRVTTGAVSMTPDQTASVFMMNAVSVGVLMVFLGWVLAGIFRGVAPEGDGRA